MKTSRAVIRTAVKSDAKEVIDYLNTISGESDFLTFGIGEVKESIEQEEEFIENTSKKDNALFILAEVDGKIVGGLNFSGGFRPRTAHIGEFGVSVLRDYWGNGIGEQLIEYLIDWCQKNGLIRKINLRVRNDNTRGIKLYKKFGFREEGLITKDYLINGTFYDSILMGLSID
jgi:RimJ/RimL family protein N-acetyltransferase